MPVDHPAQHRRFAMIDHQLQHAIIAGQPIGAQHVRARSLNRVDCRAAMGGQRRLICYHPRNEHFAFP